MPEQINNCENCHHFDSLISWEENDIFYRCLMKNKLWEKCNDYDAICMDDKEKITCIEYLFKKYYKESDDMNSEKMCEEIEKILTYG